MRNFKNCGWLVECKQLAKRAHEFMEEKKSRKDFGWCDFGSMTCSDQSIQNLLSK